MKFIHILSTFLRDPYLADFFIKKARGYSLVGKIAFMAFFEHNIWSNEYVEPLLHLHIFFLQNLNKKILTELSYLLWVLYSVYFTWASMWVLIPIKHNPWGSDGMCSVIYRCNVHRRNVQCCWTSNLFHLMLVHIQFACDHLIHCISHIMSCEMGNYRFTFLLVPSPIIALPCLVSL